jgi:hypothetical protein
MLSRPPIRLRNAFVRVARVSQALYVRCQSLRGWVRRVGMPHVPLGHSHMDWTQISNQLQDSQCAAVLELP